MAGLRLLDRIHGERPDRVRHSVMRRTRHRLHFDRVRAHGGAWRRCAAGNASRIQ
jgi:hypothetical protein